MDLPPDQGPREAGRRLREARAATVPTGADPSGTVLPRD